MIIECEVLIHNPENSIAEREKFESLGISLESYNSQILVPLIFHIKDVNAILRRKDDECVVVMAWTEFIVKYDYFDLRKIYLKYHENSSTSTKDNQPVSREV